MRIGLIGMGGIAQKAYLPVITTRAGLELFVSTRNVEVLHDIGARYRIPEERLFSQVDALLAQNVNAAFVHTATESHAELVERLLANGVHVYVDKPLTYSEADSERLLRLAADRQLVLMTGFNRRFAPSIQALKVAAQPQLIVMQKHRTNAAEAARTAVLDDFIHVVDTLLYMLPEPVVKMDSTHQTRDGLLTQMTMRLQSANCTAIGIMHREAGCDEEVLEVTGRGQRWRVTDLRESVAMHEGESRTRPGNWTNVGVVRGFAGVTDQFLKAVNDPKPEWTAYDAFQVLPTHRVCEELISRIEGQVHEG